MEAEKRPIPILFATLPWIRDPTANVRIYIDKAPAAQYTIVRYGQHTVTVVISAPLPHKELITSGDVGWLSHTMMAVHTP